jgi:type III secretory pathway component EscT
MLKTRNRKWDERWSRIRAKGARSFIVRHTLWFSLGFPLLLASVTSLNESGLSFGEFISNWPVGLWLSCVLVGLLIGPLFAWLWWATYEKEYRQSQSKEE